MWVHLIAAVLMTTGAAAFAQPAAPKTPAAAAPAETAAPTQDLAEKTKLGSFADKERAELHSFVEAAKAELDKFEEKETARLEGVAKRAEWETFTDADKAKLKALQGLMTSSSAETRKKALGDLKDNLRTETAKSIWTKYKAKKKALWTKFVQDWQKLLTSPPLMIPKKKAAPQGAHAASKPAR